MKKKLPKALRCLSWVKINPQGLTAVHIKHYRDILGQIDFLLYMGEIPNQPGHCVIINPSTQKLFAGYHIESFIEMTEEEV